MKYTFTIEAPTMRELMEKIERELGVLKKEEKEAIIHDRRMRTRITSTKRKNKAWEEHDVLFLIEHYRGKNMKWIATALQRSIDAVRTKLQSLYLSHDLPRLRSKRAIDSKKQ